MKNRFFSEISHELIFTAYDSEKTHKTALYRTHYHADTEIWYIHSGKGEFLINGNRFTAQVGDLLFIRANEQHCLPKIHSKKLLSYNFHLTSYYLWNVCSEYISSDILYLMTGDMPIPCLFHGYKQAIGDIIALMNNPDKNRFQIRHQLMLLIKDIAHELAPYSQDNPQESTPPAHLDDIQTAITYINNHLIDDITLDDICASAKLSRSHLSSLFKDITGVSPYEYLLLQRTEHALSLLRHTDKSITDIAYECGFRSQTNFNKSFKRIVGMTPSMYKKSH